MIQILQPLHWLLPLLPTARTPPRWGFATLASGTASTAMGEYFAATASGPLAAGRRAKAFHPGAFLWAAAQSADFALTASDPFLIRAQGGVGSPMNNPGGTGLYVRRNRSGGFFELTNWTGNSAPALRVVAEGRMQKLECENADLKTRLEKLEYLLNHKLKGDNR